MGYLPTIRSGLKHLLPGIAVVMAVLLILPISDVAWSSDEPSHPTRSNALVMPGFEVRENLCANATIKSSSDILLQEILRTAIDGDPSTGFDVSGLGGAPLEIFFLGRPPWLNRIYVAHLGDVNLRVIATEINNTKKELQLAEITTDSGTGISQTLLTCEEIRAISLTIEPVGEWDRSTNQSILYEVRAEFLLPDTDDGVNEVEDEWINRYRRTPCNNPNLRRADNDARSLSRGLRNRLGWTWVYDWGNALAWEQDFSVDGNFWDIDKVDFGYFSGHGSRGRFWFSHRNNDCNVWNGECVREWGDNDLDWIAISSCQTLHRSQWRAWHRCFDHLHLMCGMHTNMLDVNVGRYFSRYMARGRTIPQAWFRAQRKAHRPWWWWFWPRIRTAVVLAEVKNNYRDHAWGAGYVSPDPNYNNWYWYWYYWWFGAKEEKQQEPFERSTARAIAFPERENPTFLVQEDLLARSPREDVPRLIVDPVTIDSAYVGSLADALCAYQGIFCGSPIEYDPMDNTYSVFDGPHELYVDAETGAWDYMDSENYAMPLDSAPTLLTEPEAEAAATTLLDNIGFLPLDRTDFFDAIMLTQGRINDDTGVEDPDSTWDMTIAVGFGREHLGYQVVGSGAYVLVEYGDLGALQSINYGGWRGLSEGGFVTTISLEDALEDLAYSGPEIAIGGLPLCDTFIVDVAELGYYEAPGDSLVDELEVVWLVSGMCEFDGGDGVEESEYQIILPARYRHPRGEMLGPEDGIVISYGTPVTCTATATGGTPPYTFYWSSDIDGDLGIGETIIADLSLLDGKPARHTITVEAADANLSRDEVATVNATVNVYPTTEVALTEIKPGGVTLSQNRPNPFNPCTEITYRLPAACDVELAIYDVRGKKVKTLVSGHQAAGHRTVRWDGTNDKGGAVSGGVYFCRLQAGDDVVLREMVFMR